MAKLYPPSLGGSVPAFFGDTLIVPFVMNKTVSKSEIGGFNLIIKTVANSKQIGQLRITSQYNPLTGMVEIPEWNINTNELTFDLSKEPSLKEVLAVGQYYKLQLAYIDGTLDGGNIGYYSGVGIVKYTAKPTVTIENLESDVINMNRDSYIGSYSQEPLEDGTIRDITERVYNYTFNVYDTSGTLIETSGECLHNSFEDTSTAYSRDIYTLQKELEMNQSYYIEYIVTTNNKLVIKSNRYRIMQKESVDSEINVEVKATINPDNGYIKIQLVDLLEKDKNEHYIYGSYVLKRASDKDNYGSWNVICNFKASGETPSQWFWKDCTIEHGYTYQYALQQYNSNELYSNKILSNRVYAYFEDNFLFDGNRQLKINFNPKVSSFKNVILETKTDTIGSQFPFIFRNGNVYYKEFPISGLISYLSDDEEMFITKKEIMLEEQTHNLTHNNIAAERIFKQKVHEFLNDGNPKIFRSPTEGSFIVRLLNVSLSPIDGVGRMLHSFSATAYEIDTFNYKSFIDYGFLKTSEISNNLIKQETVLLRDSKGNPLPKGTELLKRTPALSILLQDIRSGTLFKLKYLDENKEIVENTIQIGPTGMYKIDLSDGLEFYSISLVSDGGSGSLIYSYQSTSLSAFDMIKDVEVKDFIIEQYFGKIDILETIQDIKRNVKFNYLNFSKRQIHIAYTKDKNSLYEDAACTKLITKLQETDIYSVTLLSNNNQHISQYYIDGRYPSKIIEEEYNCKFILNGNTIDLMTIENQQYLTNVSEVEELKLGFGVSLECRYLLKEITYSIEESNTTLKNEYNNYKSNYDSLLRLLHLEEGEEYYNNESGYTDKYFDDLNAIRAKVSSLWKDYIEDLDKALKEQKEASGIV